MRLVITASTIDPLAGLFTENPTVFRDQIRLGAGLCRRLGCRNGASFDIPNPGADRHLLALYLVDGIYRVIRRTKSN